MMDFHEKTAIIRKYIRFNDHETRKVCSNQFQGDYSYESLKLGPYIYFFNFPKPT